MGWLFIYALVEMFVEIMEPPIFKTISTSMAGWIIEKVEILLKVDVNIFDSQKLRKFQGPPLKVFVNKVQWETLDQTKLKAKMFGRIL